MVRILTIDGGGICGVLPAAILAHLEGRIALKTGNPEARIIHYFDFLAGTSTGGIITCLLNAPKSEDDPAPRFSAAEVLDFYVKHGTDIFKSSQLRRFFGGIGLASEKYEVTELENLLKKRLGNLRLRHALKPSLVPAYSLEMGATYFFCSHDLDEAGREYRDFFLRDVCRSTSAAPSYFEPAGVVSVSKVQHAFVDGGVFANNPTLCAIAEVSKARGVIDPTQMLLISLGTGKTPRTFDYNRFKSKMALFLVPDLIQIMMSGVSETTHHIVKNVFRTLNVSKQYIRLDAEIANPKVGEMDNASRENIDRLRAIADGFIENHETELDDLAAQLIDIGNGAGELESAQPRLVFAKP